MEEEERRKTGKASENSSNEWHQVDVGRGGGGGGGGGETYCAGRELNNMQWESGNSGVSRVKTRGGIFFPTQRGKQHATPPLPPPHTHPRPPWEKKKKHKYKHKKKIKERFNKKQTKRNKTVKKKQLKKKKKKKKKR